MKEELELNMNAYLPLRDVVFLTLRDAILKGELKPGERLMEMHLADRLGVSRTPIREAIRMLEKEGLAVTIPRKGAQVAKMTENDLENVLEVREALEELSAKSACRKWTEPELEELKNATIAFEKAAEGNDVRDIVEKDEAFHDIIYKMARNDKLMEIVSNLREQMYRYRYEYVKDYNNYSRLVEEHEKILEGLMRRDIDYVTEVMHLHLKNQVNAVRETIREQSM
ncbi:MAG: GntR family transcriptional regulator [Lachnospiraceae bacterium]|nr:GntR family transcriptional regulator [Lachnospiraceae bacterium]